MDGLSDIAHTIELAVAPVFLLAGIGALLNVVTSRLGRSVDRSRALEDLFITLGSDDDEENKRATRARDELRILDQRMVYCQRAISLYAFAALFVCVLVAFLFLGEFLHLPAAGVIAILFIAAMACLIGGLTFFLAEVAIATRILRVRGELLLKP